VRAGPSLTKQMGSDLSDLLMKFHEAPGMHAHALVQQLEGLAGKPDIAPIANAVKDQVDEMLAGLSTSESNDKGELSTVFQRFESINDDLKQKIAAAESFKTAVDIARVGNKKCREEEVPFMERFKIAEHNFQVAKKFEQDKDLIEDVQLEKLKNNGHTHVHHENRDEIHGHATALSDAIDAYRVAYQDLQGNESKFKSERDAHERKRGACNAMQQALEQATCNLKDEWKVDCARYSGAHDNNAKNYGTEVEAVKVRVADRKEQFTALKKVGCAVQLLAEHAPTEGATSGASSDFSGCFDQAVDTDHLAITYNSTPSMLDCPSVPHWPCDAAYEEQEYGNLPADAPADTCTACR